MFFNYIEISIIKEVYVIEPHPINENIIFSGDF
jgi:hypothetical protein